MYLTRAKANKSKTLVILTDDELKKKTKLRGPSPQANYTDRATAAFRRSYCQILQVEDVACVSATNPHGR
jgi:hypothetical protein